MKYKPHYKELTKKEAETIKAIKEHEKFMELYEHKIISKTELFSALKIKRR